MTTPANKTTTPTILKVTFQVEVRYKVPMELSEMCGDALETMMDDGEIAFTNGNFVYKGKTYEAHYDDMTSAVRDNQPTEMYIDEYIEMLDETEEEEDDLPLGILVAVKGEVPEELKDKIQEESKRKFICGVEEDEAED